MNAQNKKRRRFAPIQQMAQPRFFGKTLLRMESLKADTCECPNCSIAKQEKKKTIFLAFFFFHNFLVSLNEKKMLANFYHHLPFKASCSQEAESFLSPRFHEQTVILFSVRPVFKLLLLETHSVPQVFLLFAFRESNDSARELLHCH